MKHPDWFDPELVPKLEAFCRHYGTAILPTQPYMPRHKGKVERGVAYVQSNGLKGHRVRQPGGREPASGSLGTDDRRHADPRHDAPAGRQGVRGSRARRVAAAAARTIPVLPRSAADRQSRRPRRSGQSLLLRAAGISGANGLGALGCAAGADLQSSLGADRDPCAARAGPVQHARPAHRPGEDQRAGTRRGVPACPRSRSIGAHTRQWAEAMVARPGHRRDARAAWGC